MAYKDAVLEVLKEIRTIKGIRRVPDEPPEFNDQFPFASARPGPSIYKVGPAGLMTALHSIIVELYVARVDLERDYNQIMGMIELIPFELHKLNHDRGFTHLQTFGEIHQTELIPMEWAAVKIFGVEYTITEVKIQTSLIT